MALDHEPQMGIGKQGGQQFVEHRMAAMEQVGLARGKQQLVADAKTHRVLPGRDGHVFTDLVELQTGPGFLSRGLGTSLWVWMPEGAGGAFWALADVTGKGGTSDGGCTVAGALVASGSGRGSVVVVAPSPEGPASRQHDHHHHQHEGDHIEVGEQPALFFGRHVRLGVPAR
ncbi:MAG: hypothetical protein R3E42_00345 [Burkholderiaceae bacterium]